MLRKADEQRRSHKHQNGAQTYKLEKLPLVVTARLKGPRPIHEIAIQHPACIRNALCQHMRPAQEDEERKHSEINACIHRSNQSELHPLHHEFVHMILLILRSFFFMP